MKHTALYRAYKFYLHYFALYIKNHEIPADDYIYHKRLEKELLEVEQVLSSDYQQTIDELIKLGSNMAEALKEISEKYAVVWEDGGEACPAYIRWKNFVE
jgi:hypothetical protein